MKVGFKSHNQLPMSILNEKRQMHFWLGTHLCSSKECKLLPLLAAWEAHIEVKRCNILCQKHDNETSLPPVKIYDQEIRFLTLETILTIDLCR